jgi:L-alanine-DL-glutamate epimerase-like enolase superfamily enzyme
MPLSRKAAPTVEAVEARAYKVPTERDESDGTLEWNSTTMVVVEVRAADHVGIGYSYTDASAASLISSKLADVLEGSDAFDIARTWAQMVDALRNVGRLGVGAAALSAVDIALWDLKARLLGLALTDLLGASRRQVPIYGSGGFCSYSLSELTNQIEGWVAEGIPRVKIKVGRHPDEDQRRLDVSRKAAGDATELFVDANGAFSPKLALEWARRYRHEWDVRWLEEPVTSDDLSGLRLVRQQGPAGLDIAAGEYGYSTDYFARMLSAEAVDCLQADVTRCGGITGFLKAGAVCDAHHLDLSAHCAPQVSAHASAAVWHFRHLEYFHDHVRIEAMFFDGVLEPQAGGVLVPDRERPGLGLDLRRPDIERFAV